MKISFFETLIFVLQGSGLRGGPLHETTQARINIMINVNAIALIHVNVILTTYIMNMFMMDMKIRIYKGLDDPYSGMV